MNAIANVAHITTLAVCTFSDRGSPPSFIPPTTQHCRVERRFALARPAAGRQRPRAAAERVGAHRWPLPAAVRAPGPAVGPRSWGRRRGAAVSDGTAATLAGFFRRVYLQRPPWPPPLWPLLVTPFPFSRFAFLFRPARTRRRLLIARNFQACSASRSRV